MSYKIKHIKWKQKELLYPDVEPMLAILSDLGDEFKSSFEGDESKFLEFAQKCFEKKVLPRLFALILMPDSSNIVQYCINQMWMKYYKLDAGNVINVMTTAQWRQVLADFFIESSQWIQSWLHSSGLFGSESLPMNSNSSVSNLMKTILKPLIPPLETRSASSMPPMDATRKSSASESVLN